MTAPVTTLTRSQFSLFLPNDMAIRWAESLQSAVQSFVSTGGGGSLTPSGVTPGNYGTNSSVGAFTVDLNGIITTAADTPIAITFAAVSGVVPIVQGGTGQTTAPNAINALLPSQGGNTGFYLQTNGTVASWQPAPGGGGGGTVTQVNTTAGEIDGGPITVTGTLSLAVTGVTAATYGSASSTSQIAVDTKGRITSASSVAIAITGAAVSGNISGNAGNVTGVVAVANGGSGATTLTGYVKGNGASPFTAAATVPVADLSGTLPVASGGTGAVTLTGYVKGAGTSALTASATIPAADISGAVTVAARLASSGVVVGSGTLDLAASGVTPGTYGSGTAIPVPVVDTYGRITSISTVGVSGAAGGTVSLITNADGGLSITNPAGPTTNIDIGTIPVASGGTGLLVPFYVSTIAAMVALVKASLINGQVCIVLGYNTAGDGGGDPFYWDGASTATQNGGTCFEAAAGGTGRWFRLIDDVGVDMLWFNADRTGVSSSSAAFDAAYSYAGTASANYARSVFAPAGSYLVSSNLSDNLIGVKGEGYAGTAFFPTTVTGSSLTLTDTSGTLLPAFIMDIGFNNNGTRQGIGIDHIAGSGRAIVERSYIRNFEKGINRSTGNFQEWYRDVSMANNDYHIYSVSTPTAQGGSLIVEGGNYGTAEYAVNYINADTVQSGQFIYKEVFWQGANTGWTFFVKYANTQDAPAIEVQSCYVEEHHKTTNITIDGVTLVPRFAYLENCGMFRAINTLVGQFVLVNSIVETIDCNVSYVGGATNVTTIDANSFMSHRNANWYNGSNIPGLTYSVGDVQGPVSATTAAWFETPPLALGNPPIGSTSRLWNNCSASSTWGGTATTSATDSGILGLGTCQDLAFTGAQIKQYSLDTGATDLNGTYLVWCWIGKLVSGTAPVLRIKGGYTMSKDITVDSADFVTYRGMIQIDATRNFLSPEIESAATCVIRIAGLSLMTFTSKRQAIAWLNSAIFPPA